MDAKVNAGWQNGFAIFEGTAGTVTLGANISLIGMQFINLMATGSPHPGRRP